ncbi:MAG: TIGR01440 family protein [Oscillospiraceae bacterium]|jgi:uncharacterized protein (TIGR01440 family)
MAQNELKQYEAAARKAMEALLAAARAEPGELVVVGCSTSRVAGHTLGTAPSSDIASALLAGLLPPLRKAGLFLAAQCCEHLERALVVERAAMRRHGLERVNAVPQPHAGGSFATAAFALCDEPVAVARVSAVAGLDIGGTLMGMHMRAVVVPVQLQPAAIGQAPVTAARSRPRFVGGERAVYDPELY